jgi:DNA-binding transcriptional LysR family regulator
MDQTHHLRSIDLNLLVVLDALLAERHVTRAGKLLGLSQSATSNALERLRALFGDAILERSRGAMVPTPLAQALRPQLEQALTSVAKVVAPRADLATLSQTIRWSIVDYGIALLGPRLMATLRKSAPGLDLIATPWAGADEALAQVSDGALDLVVTVLAQGATALRWEPAFSQRYVVAMRRNHPARRRFSFEEWLRYPHIVVSGRGQIAGSLDAVLASHGKTRRVAMVVPSFLAVPSLLADSDLTALVPEGLLATGPYPSLITREPPVSVPSFEVGVAWHGRRDHDVATMHVVRSLVETARRITR